MGEWKRVGESGGVWDWGGFMKIGAWKLEILANPPLGRVFKLRPQIPIPLNPSFSPLFKGGWGGSKTLKTRPRRYEILTNDD